MAASAKKFNPLQFLSFSGRYRILHMTWFAFFLTFMAWFNMAPLATTMKEQLDFLKENPKLLKALAICNVALTIPARIIIGMLLDRFGPRKVYTGLLTVMAIPCMVFAFADEAVMMIVSRLLLGVIGAGFVIGIRMVSEWFPPKDVGEAEGIYGGFGNFGSAASAFLLPTIALDLFGGENGWRYAIALTGVNCFIYGIIYFFSVQDTPPGKTYHRPKRGGAMEVTSWAGLWGLILMQLPMIVALGLLTYNLHNLKLADGSTLLPTQAAHIIYGLLIAIFLFQAYKAWTVNAPHLKKGYPEKDKYDFRQVIALDWAYFVTFGSELAVVSMLPAFFEGTWTLTPQEAGMIASCFAFMNLAARPGGGFLSDKLGSRRWTLTVLVAGLAVGYFLMGALDSAWPVPVAVLVTMFCSFFVQAGEGAVFAVVPLVKKRITGQVAGMAGAYGNVGAVTFLFIFSMVDNPSIFFWVIGGCAVFCAFLCAALLKEPKGSFAEHHHDDEHHDGHGAEAKHEAVHA